MLVLFSRFGYNEINIHTYIHTTTLPNAASRGLPAIARLCSFDLAE